MYSLGFQDSEERVSAFIKQRDEDSNEGHRIVPVVYLKPKEGKEGNAKHLIHDLIGVIQDPQLPTPFDDNVIQAQISSSMADEFRRAAAQAGYLRKASIRWTTKRLEVIKN